MSNKEEKDISQYSGKSILYIAIMHHKKGFLICILLALLSSTFAWFYRNLTAMVTTDVQVSSWNVKIGDGESENSLSFEKLYPGVEYIHTDEKNIINVLNDGEEPAYLTLEIKDLYLFGNKLIKYNDKSYNEDPLNYKSDYKLEEDKTLDETTNKVTSARYTVEGLPFVLIVNFPKTLLNPGESTTIEFDLVWAYRGDLTPVEVTEGENVITIPTCQKNILSSDVLTYVKEQKQAYEAIDIVINDDPNAEDKEGEINISTCDIIDTYYGEQAKKFDDIKSQNNVQEGDTNFIIEGETEIRPTSDLKIELSINASQAS